jgi:ABC-type transport system involved in multi-copper enzyme maturation permease subunit
MRTVLALAGVVIKELYRRKDFYVLFVLTALITVLMGSVNFFHEKGIVRYLKEICLLLLWVSGLVIAIVTTARQIPAERENRTIFPLLAKPVSRAQVVIGKFLGCWLACGLALIVFYVFFGLISGPRESHWPFATLLQALWFQWLMLGIVAAFVLFGSLVFAAPSSNATISFVLVFSILFLGGYLNRVALQQSEPLRTVVYTIYYVIPHLEWYDLRNFVINDKPAVGLANFSLATLYALGYMAFLLFATWLVFRRKALNT